MVSLSSSEVKSLQKIIDYILDTEWDSYEEFLRDRGEEDHHVMYHATMMSHILSLKSELPDTVSTGDVTLNKFKGGK
jgi:hypothetical protein